MIIDFALLGVFTDINNQLQVRRYLSNSTDKIYWFPWGNRQKNLRYALNHLVTNYGWESEDRNFYMLYKSQEDKSNTLKFFHHDSYAQLGNGKINYRYDIKYIAIAEKEFGIKKTLEYSVLNQESETWFGFSDYKSAKRLREPLDFASDFEVIESFTTGKKHQMHETEDSHFLYYDVAIVCHFTHGRKQPCTCPQCISSIKRRG